MPHVTNDGGQVAFDVTGRGEGTGFLFAQRKVGWDRMGYVSTLAARGAKVLVVDPRGYGDSSRCRQAAGYSLDGFCDDLLAAADAVGLDRFVAWGYSNTAALAIALALRTDRCVGVACCGMEPFLDFTAPLSHLDAEARLAGEGEYADGGGFDWRAAFAFYAGYTDQQRRFPERLPCPGVVVHGADDPLVAPSVERNEARIRDFGLEIVVLPGLDHATCVEATDAVIAAVDRVLLAPNRSGVETTTR
jgi:pimeloyl-ACP methyl ester carboxylesterase